MSPSFCTFFAELHCRNLKGRETIEVCMCVRAYSGDNTLRLERDLKLTLKEQHFYNVPRRCYLVHWLLFSYSFRQAGFLEDPCTQRQ